MTELPYRKMLLSSLSILFVLGASLFSYCAKAGELSTPHTFVPGTRAIAVDVDANFEAVEAAVNDNNSRITALEEQIAILLGNVLPPSRAIRDALGTIFPILDRVTLQGVANRFHETWQMPTGLVRAITITEEIDPLDPTADLAVTVTPTSGLVVTECANQNMTYVMIGIPADPTLRMNLGVSGASVHNAGGGKLDGELISHIYFSTLQTVDTTSLTFVASYAAVENVFVDTGFSNFFRSDTSCSLNGDKKVGFAAMSNSSIGSPSSPSNVLRVELYTAPIVSLPATPPFTSVVE